jgi:hypothetical protein
MKNYNRPPRLWQGHRDSRRRKGNMGRERHPVVSLMALAKQARQPKTEEPKAEAKDVVEPEHIESNVEMVSAEKQEQTVRGRFQRRRKSATTEG